MWILWHFLGVTKPLFLKSCCSEILNRCEYKRQTERDRESKKGFKMDNRLYRLKEIIGDKKADPPIPAIIPVSKSAWHVGVISKRFPLPVKHLGKRTSAYRKCDIDAVLAGTYCRDTAA